MRDVGAAQGKFTNGRMRSYKGVVLHVNDADSGDLFGWITGNNGMSCHWQVLKDGTIYQYIPTEFSSWCQAGGNDDYLSIETQGYPGQPLTTQQVAACGTILAYARSEHGVLLQVADKPGALGLGWHGMGAAAWGNHPNCPGDLRKAQRGAILTAAGAAPAKPTPAPAPATGATLRRAWPSYIPKSEYFGLITGPNASHGGYYVAEREDVRAIQQRFQALGRAPQAASWADGLFEQPTYDVVAKWQRDLYRPLTTRFGEVWSDDWVRLFTY